MKLMLRRVRGELAAASVEDDGYLSPFLSFL